MRKKASGGQASICVDEEVRISVQHSIKNFLEKDDIEFEFPSSLSSTERAYIHRLCAQKGLTSKSKGKGSNRHITIRKKRPTDTSETAIHFTFGQNSTRVLHSLLHRWPVKLKEKLDLQPRSNKQQPMGHDSSGFRPDASKTSGRLNNGIPQVPVKKGRSDLESFRKSLPVASMSDQLLTAIDENPVVLICGETGSGKTTQIPQFILDDCYASERRCRILCTQPRRISAVAMAERVATERGECVGHTVGYQIRLESRVSPRTLLTFCTNGVLLRTLMAGDNALSTVTHVIVDEVHERDRFCDFLLIKLKQLIQSRGSPRHPKFKLILMSAALDVDLFVNYFNNCPVINIPGKMYNVKEYYLEDILKMTGQFGEGVSSLQKWIQKEQENKDTNANKISSATSDLKLESDAKAIGWRIESMDDALYALWHKASTTIDEGGDDDIPNPFPQIFHLIQSENVPVDYRHSETGVTALMASAMHGAVEECEKLLSFDADPSLQVSNGWTAADMAYQLGHEDLAELISTAIAERDISTSAIVSDSAITNSYSSTDLEMSEEDRQLVANYQQGFDDEFVDADLIVQLLLLLCKENDTSAILIFLPGYDDIVTLRELILSDELEVELGNFKLFILHSSMQSSTDQKLVFKPPPQGYRKIILSTNIAETAVTIEDVVYVIDAGKVKIKIYEALTSTSILKSVWISKSSSLQRKGRAGRCRPGICFHLFSSARYNAMSEYQTAELLRTPLHELCLQAKLLATTPKKRRSKGDSSDSLDSGRDSRNENVDSIADFLSRAPESPSRLMLDNAVDLLKTIDALDPWEDMTELGHHLVDLPIEPRLGKMLLYSVVLKCLDPVLTIACALAYKDPFMLPQAPQEKKQALGCRIKFAAGAFSDHMCLLRAFQAWQKARSDGWEKSFCDRNYLSPATMQMIIGMRTQLLGQLRAAGFVRARGGSDIRDLNTNSENWAVVKAALCASTYPNILRLDREDMRLRSRLHKKVRFHMSSVLAKGGKNARNEALATLPTNWVVYDELTMSSGHFSGLATARCCTLVTPACISLFSGPSHLPESEAIVEANCSSPGDFNPMDSDSESEEPGENQQSILCITDWIKLKMDPQLSSMIVELRIKWYSLFLRRIRAPAKPWLPEDEAVLSSIINILSSEDQAHNLLQPSGIGQRPRPMSQEDSQRGFTGVRIKTPSKKRTPEPLRPSPRSREVTPHGGTHSRPSSGRRSATLGESSAEPSPRLSPPIPESLSPSGIAPSTAQICYLAVICKSQKNIGIAQTNGVWLACSEEEKLLSLAFKTSAKVLLLVFYDNMTYSQGYARLTSHGAKFANASESQNFGWEMDKKQGNQELTAFYSLEWISKIPKQIETSLLENEKKTIWEIDPLEGEQILNHVRYIPTPGLLSPQTGVPSHPYYQSNPYSPYGYPAFPSPDMYNPYQQGSSPLHPMYQQRFPPMGQYFNPYQQPPFNQNLMSPSTQQTSNFLGQNK